MNKKTWNKDHQVEFLFIQLWNLCNNNENKVCFVTDPWLVKLFYPEISRQTIWRYLNQLKRENRITIETTKLLIDDKTGKLYKKRYIRIIGQEEPRVAERIRKIECSELNREEKSKLQYEIIHNIIIVPKEQSITIN